VELFIEEFQIWNFLEWNSLRPNEPYIDSPKYHRNNSSNPETRPRNGANARVVDRKPQKSIGWRKSAGNKDGEAAMFDRISTILRNLSRDERGAAMAEYVVLLGLIVGALVLVVTNFSNVLQGKFAAVCAALGGTC
jgi:Flp pilus assembly pilin Flp